ncbi:MAG: Asp23/Gls24 family envelope stress response protein [Anaerolineaceae bacterium]|nr:Asp23/Gls24 family envelope stress response protein [Anaerolineaceae bacterium]
MSEQTHTEGKTSIAPDVLVTIARLTALGVPGVSRLAKVPGGVDRFFKRGASEGVRITVENATVYADLHVILKRDVNVRDVSHTIQTKVSRAISEMVGMEVGKVNIHIEDIESGSSELDCTS